ncbi:hypothetical protein [Actinoplanes sp. NPDC026670]|uniref:hypothetical protein n=1 Tax=Actinoplanes sp. NPDC026670 TaxID=3154700 RepID=UPI0033D4F20F
MSARPWWAVAAVLGVTGCTSLPAPPEPAPVNSPAPVTPGPAASLPTQDDLRRLLLTADDLPGYTLQPEPPGASPGSASSEFTGCPALTPSSEGPSVTVAVNFSGGLIGPKIGETITASSGEQAQRTVDGIAALARQCPAYTAVTGGQTMTMTVVAMELAPMGDASAGLQMTGTVPNLPPVRAEAIVIRSGNLVIQVSQATAFPPDRELTLSTARRALEKAEQGR